MFVYMFCTSVRVYECAWRRGGGRYVFCKSGIITIPHLNISIPFAMFNLSGGNSPSTDTSYVKWFVLFNFSRLAGGRNKQIYYAIMYCIKQEILSSQ